MTKIAESIATIVTWLQYAGIEDMDKIESTLLGGDPTSKQLREELLRQLNSFGFSNIKDLNPESQLNIGPRKFVVDASNGKIIPDIMPAKPENPIIREARLFRSKSRGDKEPLQPEITAID